MSLTQILQTLPRGFATVSSWTALFLMLLTACGTNTDGTAATSGADAGSDASPSEDMTLHPNAPPLPGQTECTVVIDNNIPVDSAMHLPTCTPVDYGTNPPSGGNHWGIWANFKEYQNALPREVYVHDLEHGAVVLAYNCTTACPDVLDALRSVTAQSDSDSRCLQFPGGPERRIIITPDPKLNTPIAAAAWGATYTATCIDEPSLFAFIAEHYAKGPEDICNPGVDFDDPSAPIPMCTPTP